MRDSEIIESANLLKVLQKTKEKENEELIHLTLAVTLIEGIEQRIQLLLQQCKQVDVIYLIVPQNSLQNEVSWLMRDSEIRESTDSLRVLQNTREKQNEELILLTLAVPQIEGVEKRIQLLLQQCKQLDVSSQIIM